MIAGTHPHHPTASRPVLWTLGWWDVVNTETLYETPENADEKQINRNTCTISCFGVEWKYN